MLSSKLGYNRPCGSGEENENEKFGMPTPATTADNEKKPDPKSYNVIWATTRVS